MPRKTIVVSVQALRGWRRKLSSLNSFDRNPSPNPNPYGTLHSASTVPSAPVVPAPPTRRVIRSSPPPQYLHPRNA